MLTSDVVFDFSKQMFDYFKTNLDVILAKVPLSYELLFSFAIIFLASFLFIILTRRRLEFIPIYILTGIIIGPAAFKLIKNTEIINLLSEIGIAFLLFVAGMEMNMLKLKDTSKDIIKIGIFQFLFISIISFLSFYLLKLPILAVIYLSFVLSLSSTVVIVKVMTDKRELNTLHARILLGVLILQDIFAILFLTLFRQSKMSLDILFYMVNFFAFILLVFIFKKFVVHRFLDFSSKNSELLLIFSLSLLFVFSLLSILFGLSVVIGSFLAGITLSDSRFKVEVEGRIKPLRDFFALLFFVALGMQLSLSKFSSIVIPFVISLLIVFVIKPITVYFLSEFFGYKRTTGFAIALPLANLSEFGLIIALQGLYLGHISMDIFNLISLTTIITMAISPYLIKNHYAIYKLASKTFIFKLGKEKKLSYKSPEAEKILLIGCHRMGSIILEKLSSIKNKIFVIDHNPDIIKALIRKKITCVYGDASNTEILEMINWSNIEIIISTLPNKEINKFLINYAKEKNQSIVAIVTAEKVHDAIDLYKANADFVILPYTISGNTVYEYIKSVFGKKKRVNVSKMKKQQIKFLEKIHKILY